MRKENKIKKNNNNNNKNIIMMKNKIWKKKMRIIKKDYTIKIARNNIKIRSKIMRVRSLKSITQ